MTGNFYGGVFLKRQDTYSKQIRPKRGMAYLQLLHKNAPAHKMNQVKGYLTSKRVTILIHLPYSPDLAPFDMFNSKNT